MRIMMSTRKKESRIRDSVKEIQDTLFGEDRDKKDPNQPNNQPRKEKESPKDNPFRR